MRIGLIRPHEIEYNRQDLADLESAAKSMGHAISSIFIDKLGIDIKGNRIGLSQIVSRNEFESIDVDGAILRHL
ncbi:MAG: RimK family alpha-L-glutamate ligase, partial [Candidatus Micrarchaeota archaeon]|nr:RimK family alpha-L-glutamate ligase [Candidatus Micrarchaeota archaeon]